MTDKLFYSVLLVMFNLAVVQSSFCYAEDVPPVPAQAKPLDRRVPDHEIIYKETLAPDWKTTWDFARTLYRDKKYPEALVQYEILFTQKENIDEARWEYVSILMYLKRWNNAKAELEKLLAAEPESIRYLLAMARVSLENGNIDNGVALYGKLLEKTLTEAEKIIVLEGLVKGREALGQKEEAAALLGQLIILKPRDPSLLLRQAALELAVGNAIGAKELCGKYDQSAPRDIEVLVLHALIEERLNHNDNAASYWRKVIALDSENAEAHRHLSRYYFAEGNWEMSFNHLEPLVKMTPNDVVLLDRAADLNMRMGRVDRALEYYEYGLAVDPLNQDLKAGKDKAQKILAEELLALVENDGGRELWQDLADVMPDCAGVYREMANLLREQGKVEDLLEVLLLLNKQVPDDQGIYDELAELLTQQGHLDTLSALRAGRSGNKKPATH